MKQQEDMFFFLLLLLFVYLIHLFVYQQMGHLSKEEFVHVLRRQSTGLPRGSSKYRGVTLHKCGRWEARMGQFLGKKYACRPSSISLIAFDSFLLPNHFLSSSFLPIPASASALLSLSLRLSSSHPHYSWPSLPVCVTAGTSTWACSTPRRKPPGKIIGPHCVLARRFLLGGELRHPWAAKLTDGCPCLWDCRVRWSLCVCAGRTTARPSSATARTR